MLRARFAARGAKIGRATGPDNDVFRSPNMLRVLESWGEGNAWTELQLIMAGRTGRVLDIGCGPGHAIKMLSQYPGLDVYGCDLSKVLIDIAIESGILPDRLAVMDATDMSAYGDKSFDWAYTLGVLHYFGDEEVDKCLCECFRVTKGSSFHLISADKQNRNMGWVKTFQSYQNNSLEWWERKCRAVYPHVQVIDSGWADDFSFGRWIICSKST